MQEKKSYHFKATAFITHIPCKRKSLRFMISVKSSGEGMSPKPTRLEWVLGLIPPDSCFNLINFNLHFPPLLLIFEKGR